MTYRRPHTPRLFPPRGVRPRHHWRMPTTLPPPVRGRHEPGLHARPPKRRHPLVRTEQDPLEQPGRFARGGGMELEHLDGAVLRVGQPVERLEGKRDAESAGEQSEDAEQCAERGAVDERSQGVSEYGVDCLKYYGCFHD